MTSGGISLSRQIAKAVRDVPHDVECLKAAIDERFHCTCPDRDERIAEAMTAAFKTGGSWRYAGRPNDDFWMRMLRAFTAAAMKSHERSEV